MVILRKNNSIARDVRDYLQPNQRIHSADAKSIAKEVRTVFQSLFSMLRHSRDLLGVRCCFSPTAYGTDRRKDLYKDLEFVRVKKRG